MEKALFRNNLIKKITAALMIVMLLIPYCFAQVTFGDNKSDLKNAQNQQNDIQNKKNHGSHSYRIKRKKQKTRLLSLRHRVQILHLLFRVLMPRWENCQRH